MAHNHFLHCSTDFIAFYFNKKIKTDRRQMFFFFFVSVKVHSDNKKCKMDKVEKKSFVSESVTLLFIKSHGVLCQHVSALKTKRPLEERRFSSLMTFTVDPVL